MSEQSSVLTLNYNDTLCTFIDRQKCMACSSRQLFIADNITVQPTTNTSTNTGHFVQFGLALQMLYVPYYVCIYTVSQKKMWCRTFCDNFINC